MDIQKSLSRLLDGRDLSLDEMKAVMSQIMTGAASDAQTISLSLRAKMGRLA